MTDFMDKLELVAALLKARQSFEPMAKSGSHSQFGKYAKLSDVLNAVRPALTENGLQLLQPPDIKDGVTCLHTILLHESGQAIDSWYPIKEDTSGSKNDLQAEGSGITYQRKYSICMLLGIDWGQDDRDGSRGRQSGDSDDNVGDTKNDLIKLEKKVIAGGMTQEEVDIVKKAMLGDKGFGNPKETLEAYGDDLKKKSELNAEDLKKALYGADANLEPSAEAGEGVPGKGKQDGDETESAVMASALKLEREYMKTNKLSNVQTRKAVLGTEAKPEGAEAWKLYRDLLSGSPEANNPDSPEHLEDDARGEEGNG